MKALMLTIAVCAGLLVAGCGGGSDSSSGESTAAGGETTAAEAGGGEKTKPKVTVPEGPPPKKLEIKEIEAGSGAEAKSGDEVTVQ